jgi:hypothetical protein
MHIRGTRIEREAEIYATNLANKTECMNTKAQKKIWKNLIRHIVPTDSATWGRKWVLFPKRCFLVSRKLDDGQSKNPSDSECYTSSSEPFRIHQWRPF